MREVVDHHLTASSFVTARSRRARRPASPLRPDSCLQYYDYDTEDELIGRVRPERGDRLELVRQVGNRYDQNTVDVRWRNGRVHLGHLPREIAAIAAPLLDRGVSVRCYAINGGDGSSCQSGYFLVSAALSSVSISI